MKTITISGIFRVMEDLVLVAVALLLLFPAILEHLGVPFDEPRLTRGMLAFLAIYLVSERILVLNHIRARVDVLSSQVTESPAQCYMSPDEAYAAVTKTIAEVGAGPAKAKTIYHAALIGLSGQRIGAPPRSKTFQAFVQALAGAVKSSGPSAWSVREMFNVPNDDRLAQMERWLQDSDNARTYEARAFCMPETIPCLAPLIVGEENLFLAIEDPRYYSISKCLHIRSSECVALVRQYFDLLWGDRRAFVIRTASSLDDSEFRRLRETVKTRAVKHV